MATSKHTPGPWYDGSSTYEEGLEQEIERLEAVNAQLLEALERAEIAMSECPINVTNPLFAPLLHARDIVRIAIKAAIES